MIEERNAISLARDARVADPSAGFVQNFPDRILQPPASPLGSSPPGIHFPMETSPHIPRLPELRAARLPKAKLDPAFPGGQIPRPAVSFKETAISPVDEMLRSSVLSSPRPRDCVLSGRVVNSSACCPFPPGSVNNRLAVGGKSCGANISAAKRELLVERRRGPVQAAHQKCARERANHQRCTGHNRQPAL